MAGAWLAFRHLSSARRSGMGGPEPIGWPEIQAYVALAEVELEPWEVDAVRALDLAFMEEMSARAERDRAARETKRR